MVVRLGSCTPASASASNLQHEIRRWIRQLSLRGKPDVHYFVDHVIDSRSQPTAARRRASALRGNGARYRVCQEPTTQTIHSCPVHPEQLRSEHRLLFRERSSPQWTGHV